MKKSNTTSTQPSRASDLFFDGGWCWMAHPEFNDGNAIPVKMEIVNGVRWFYPLDPTDAEEHEWDRRDKQWRIISPATAEADADFDLMCSQAAAKHLATLVVSLRLDKADLLGVCEAVIAFIEGKPDAVEPFGHVRAAIARAKAG